MNEQQNMGTSKEEISEKSEIRPSRRLVTQNMLISAAAFEHKQVTWATVRDLSSLIDIFCLYRHAVILGKDAELGLYGLGLDLFNALRNEEFLQCEVVSSLDLSMVLSCAGNHMKEYLGLKVADGFRDLLTSSLNPASEFYKLEGDPDGNREILIATKWLTARGGRMSSHILDQIESGISRGATFLTRSFLYYAFSDVKDMVLTPDAVRAPVLGRVLKAEEQFRGKLIKKLRHAGESIPGDKRTLRRTSPFAALVFHRAKGDKRAIVPEMMRLRADASKFRARLVDLEGRMLGEDRKTAKKAAAEWLEVIRQIEEKFTVDDPARVRVRQGLKYAESGVDVIADPQNPTKWAKLAEGLDPDLILRLTARRTAVEFHKLLSQKNLPGAGRLRADIKDLFSHIEDDAEGTREI